MACTVPLEHGPCEMSTRLAFLRTATDSVVGVTGDERLRIPLDHFDVAEGTDPSPGLDEAALHPELVELVTRLRYTDVDNDLTARALRLTAAAPEPTDDEKRSALRAHLWFLDRAAGEGTALTDAGYLKPADVRAACAILPAMAGWPGATNRERHCQPLRAFRRSLQRMGLMRRHNGRLVLTRLGRSAHQDLAVLWDLLAESLLPSSEDRGPYEAGLLLLLHAATATATDGVLRRDLVVAALGEAGWSNADGSPLDEWDLFFLDPGVVEVLANVTAMPLKRDEVSSVASALARAALQVGGSG